MMELLSIEATDPSYHLIRAKTTLGLQVGSLAVGGYGAVKGVIGFSRLARAPAQIGRMTSTLKIGKKLNRFHQSANNLSEVGQNNIRILRNWAKSKGWRRLPNRHGGPEIWGVNLNGRFEFRLKVKPEASLRMGLDPKSGVPRFDARLNRGKYINPFTGEVGNSNIGSHLPLEYYFYE